MNRRPAGFLCVILLALLPSAAHALRCPKGVVGVGDHVSEVLDACGEPAHRAAVVEQPSRVISVDGRAVAQVLPTGLVVEEWVYEFSPQRFRRLLRFRGNRLLEIRKLDKPD